LKWYRKAAEQGNALAKTNLGLLNEKLEEAFDYSEAMESLHKMAEQGFASAQYNLGVCYWNGEDVEKDNVKATIWFRKAAEQGFVEAQKMLGFAYLNGNGVPQNDFEAYYWFRLAQEFGCENLANALVVAGAPFPSSEERERLYQEFRVQKNFKK
jgi:TPR repeat protein